MSECLVDLSLFSYSPTSDHYLSLGATINNLREAPVTNVAPDGASRSRSQRDRATQTSHRHTRRPAIMRSLPRPPPRIMCGAFAVPREGDISAGCLLNRMKRKHRDISPGQSNARLPQRRNRASPPELRLSASSRDDYNLPSELVWMPEEQMWLVVGEGERNRGFVSPDRSQPIQHPISPVTRARSGPIETNRHQGSLTPSPSNTHVRRRQIVEERDEERLSPLFHEAMNSVPMEDTFEAPPPPSYEGLMRARSASPGFTSPTPPIRALTFEPSFGVSPQSAPMQNCPNFQRAASAGPSPITSVYSQSANTSPISRHRRRSSADPRLISATNNPTIWTAPASWDIALRRTRQPEPTVGHSSNSLPTQNGARSAGLWSNWARRLANP